MSQENTPLVNRIAIDPEGSKRVPIPVISDDKVFYCIAKDKAIVLTQLDMSGVVVNEETIGGFKTDKLEVLTDREKGFVVIDDGRVSYLDLDGNLNVLTNNGPRVITETLPADFSLPGSFISCVTGKAFLTHINVIYSDEHGLVFNPQYMELTAHIPNELTAVLTPLNHSVDWSLYSSTEDSATKGGLYSVYKNQLSRLPVEMFDAIPAVRGIEIIKRKGVSDFYSSFVPMDDLDRAIKGNTTRFKLIVEKDNTLLPNFKSTGPYMTKTNSRVTKGILLEGGLYVPSDQGLNKLVQPFTNRPLSIIGDKQILVVTTS